MNMYKLNFAQQNHLCPFNVARRFARVVIGFEVKSSLSCKLIHFLLKKNGKWSLENTKEIISKSLLINAVYTNIYNNPVLNF